MDPNLLKTNELTYELLLRDVDSSKMKVDEKRKFLRGCLSQENGNRSFVELTNPLKFMDDILGIKETYDNLNLKISNFVGDINDCKRIETRLNHLSGRIARLNALEPDQLKEKQDLRLLLLTL